jgi:hypothetical protein
VGSEEGLAIGFGAALWIALITGVLAWRARRDRRRAANQAERGMHRDRA